LIKEFDDVDPVLGTRIKKGYAEKAIIDTILDLMDQSVLDG